MPAAYIIEFYHLLKAAFYGDDSSMNSFSYWHNLVKSKNKYIDKEKSLFLRTFCGIPYSTTSLLTYQYGYWYNSHCINHNNAWGLNMFSLPSGSYEVLIMLYSINMFNCFERPRDKFIKGELSQKNKLPTALWDTEVCISCSFCVCHVPYYWYQPWMGSKFYWKLSSKWVSFGLQPKIICLYGWIVKKALNIRVIFSRHWTFPG